MSPVRRIALVAGVLYLVTFVSSIPAVFLLDPVLSDPRYVLGSGDDGRVVLGCLLDIVNAVACVGTAVALFPVVRRQSEGLALGFVTSRVYEAGVIMIGVVSLLAVVTLRRDGIDGAHPDSLVAVAGGLVDVRNWTFLLGPSLAPGFNALLLGYLLLRSGLVPRVVPVLGLVGGPLIIAATVARMFAGPDDLTALAGVATLPIFLWELSLGLYLTFRGFRPSPVTAGLVAPA
jgi:hypothetical protein